MTHKVKVQIVMTILSFYRFPIVEPDPGHTKLRLSTEGLEAIRRITNPIAAVAVSFIFKAIDVF